MRRLVTLLVGLVLGLSGVFFGQGPLVSVDTETLRIGTQIEIAAIGVEGSETVLRDATSTIRTGTPKYQDGVLTIPTPLLFPEHHTLTVRTSSDLITVDFDAIGDFDLRNATSSVTSAVNWKLVGLSSLLLVLALLLLAVRRLPPVIPGVLAALASVTASLALPVWTAVTITGGLTLLLLAGAYIMPKIRSRAVALGVVAMLSIASMFGVAGIALASETASVTQKCTPGSSDAICRGMELEGVRSAAGMNVVMDQLRAMPGGFVSSDCHEVAHWAGRFAAVQSGAAALLEQVTEHCQWGYLHGVAEQVGQTSDDRTWDEFTLACDRYLSDAAKADRCAHGLGHAALRRAQGSINTALVACGDRKALSFECSRAVYMEAFVMLEQARKARRAIPSIGVRVGDSPVVTCLSLAEERRGGCLEYVWTAHWPEDLATAKGWIAACATLSPSLRVPCDRSIGRTLGTFLKDGSMDYVPVCSLTPNSEECYQMAISWGIGAIESGSPGITTFCSTYVPQRSRCPEEVATRLQGGLVGTDLLADSVNRF